MIDCSSYTLRLTGSVFAKTNLNIHVIYSSVLFYFSRLLSPFPTSNILRVNGGNPQNPRSVHAVDSFHNQRQEANGKNQTPSQAQVVNSNLIFFQSIAMSISIFKKKKTRSYTYHHNHHWTEENLGRTKKDLKNWVNRGNININVTRLR